VYPPVAGLFEIRVVTPVRTPNGVYPPGVHHRSLFLSEKNERKSYTKYTVKSKFSRDFFFAKTRGFLIV